MKIRSAMAKVFKRTSVCGRVNLNAFCRRLPTAAMSKSRLPAIARLADDSVVTNEQPCRFASRVADSLIYAMKASSAKMCGAMGSPVEIRASASERSMSVRNPTRLRLSTAPVAPVTATLPLWIRLNASVAVVR